MKRPTLGATFGGLRMQENRFQIDLRGIIDLLANHLYSSPEVVIRELIQNGVDAISARRALDAASPGHVQLELTPGPVGSATLMVEDDGIGLTLGEVHEFLSTIGKSSKSEDLQAMDGREGFLGRFGIGLLSCFMLSDEIVVLTRSAKEPGSPAVEWRGKADGSYAVRAIPELQLSPGTRVYLRCKDGAEEYFEPDRLHELARHYAEMLPVRITLHTPGSSVLINASFIPWQAGLESHTDQSLMDYCQGALGFKPIDSIPLSSVAGGVTGFAFVTSGASSHASDEGHRVYLKGMFVDPHARGLLPDWAFFVRCVLNAQDLRPVASREGLYRDQTLEQAAEELGRQIRDHIVRLIRTDPDKLELILGIHGTAIRALAREDRDFFDLVIDVLEFETNLGEIRFGEFRRENTSILVARTAEQFRRVAHVAAALGIRVFNGAYTHHEELLARAAERFDGMEISTFDSSDLLARLPEHRLSPSVAERIIALGDEALSPHSCTCILREFPPATVTAIYGLGLDGEFHRQIARSKAMASGHWGEVIDALQPAREEAPPTRLALNVANPLVAGICECGDDALVREAVELLYVQSLMSGMHPLSDAELTLLNTRLLTLLRRAIGGMGRP